MGKLKMALICGGPSLERGISLNSARSVMDHLFQSPIEIRPLYMDVNQNLFQISLSQLYSNTPADFDFKLQEMSQPLSLFEREEFFKQVDFAFPVIHGKIGEDGSLQEELENCGVPFIGSSSIACKKMFHKEAAASLLKEHGFFTLPNLKIDQREENFLPKLSAFFSRLGLKKAIVKPVSAGSSIGVFSVNCAVEAKEKCLEIFSKDIDTEALVEPFCVGCEFSIVVLQNSLGEAIPLIPTSIQMDYQEKELFDYRRKYLPTNQVTYHTPALFSIVTIQEIRKNAAKIFNLFKMRDFARLDGWVLEDGTVYFSDLNPISGLEQNSFFFRQTSLLGMTHQEALNFLIKNCCLRSSLFFDEQLLQKASKKQPVYVLFGNDNAERQVSLMSGTNVWLKLLQSNRFYPVPCLYDQQKKVWELPYQYALEHTVEEVYQNCLNGAKNYHFAQDVIKEICIGLNRSLPIFESPQERSWEEFLHQIKSNSAFLFLALHGGSGENGILQKSLEDHKIFYNGSDSNTSSLCMDKYLTGEKINELAHPDLKSLPKVALNFSSMDVLTSENVEVLWRKLSKELQSDLLIIKPREEGCSAGIALITSPFDLLAYYQWVNSSQKFIPANTFINQLQPIDLPPFNARQFFILEPYIETDKVSVKDKFILNKSKTGWIELTIGVLETKDQYHALSPSLTIAEGAFLSLEEKFQGGTGINLTPPPKEVLSWVQIQKIRALSELAAKSLGIRNYARLDIFFNRKTEKMILIEANTLPALTPSTVFYHQALAEALPLNPLQLLEQLIESILVK